MNECKIKPAALSLVHSYSEDFVLKNRTVKTIPDLFDEKYIDTPYNEPIKACNQVEVNMTDEDIKII